jgi:hypothetical protein
MIPKLACKPARFALPILLLVIYLCFPASSAAQVYGIEGVDGKFVPKIRVRIAEKEIVISKVKPKEKFSSISLALNKKNRALLRNVGLLDIQWIDTESRPGKPLNFAARNYNPRTGVFRDTMTKSAALKIIDKTARDLFADKDLSDLLTIHIEGKLCVPHDSYVARQAPDKLTPQTDLSIHVDKSSITFDQSNLKTGEMVNVDNRSGYPLMVGIELPEKGLLYYQIIRKPDQIKVPKESWQRFTIDADSGVFVVLIPESDPAELASLDGKEIVIKVWEGDRIRETRAIPIRTSSDIRVGPGDESAEGGFAPPPKEPAARSPRMPESREPAPVTEPSPERPTSRGVTVPTDLSGKAESGSGLWVWAVQVFNFVLLAVLGMYGIFFMLPRIQVLEDRLAKSEMFIHSSREAIREELEEVKEEIIRQCRTEDGSE